MKVDMSPKAIENRLKLVGELTKACLLIRQNSKVKNENKGRQKSELKKLKSRELKFESFLKRRTSRVK